ncbi:MAG: endonuclease domain-containing protein, partial [Dethiobacteria bacterium]|nr:endonuclease domain-containing protein [Dethiobacteria bacterium]
ISLIKQKQYTTNPKLAKSLRKSSTDAELLLWRYLRNRSFEGVKFRRQQPFGPYIVDFISLNDKLIIELDGGQHNLEAEKVRDKVRDQYIEDEGYKVMRFWNNDLTNNIEGVLESIRLALLKDSPSPRPSPPEGRGS